MHNPSGASRLHTGQRSRALAFGFKLFINISIVFFDFFKDFKSCLTVLDVIKNTLFYSVFNGFLRGRNTSHNALYV